jgi:hypothetical protein|tara:strand:+ start:434 stop:607 length:174 start_codon:yes stop_codon:yes gene_type:complete
LITVTVSGQEKRYQKNYLGRQEKEKQEKNYRKQKHQEKRVIDMSVFPSGTNYKYYVV